MTGTKSLETLMGPLAETLPLFEEGTVLTCAQLMNERRTNPDLRTRRFYTANFALYRVEDGKEVLYFGTEENPIFKNLDKAMKQLAITGNYIPSAEDIEAVVNSNALKLNLRDLNLKRHAADAEYPYFEINTAGYDRLTNTQREFAERVYGEGTDFEANMEMLAEAGIKTTSIYVSTPDYVKGKVQEGSAISQASTLSDFFCLSSFAVGISSVGDHVALRGVCKVVAEGDQQFDYAGAIRKLVQTPDQTLKHLNHENAAALLDLVNRFYGSTNQ